MGGWAAALAVAALAYAVTAAALIAAALWGVIAANDMEDAARLQPRRVRALSVAVGLAAVQALLWARLGAGLGG